MPAMNKIIILAVFVACYALALSRKVKIAYASLGASAVLLLLGILTPVEALFKAIKWDVLGIYWGFMMVSLIFKFPQRKIKDPAFMLCRTRHFPA